MKRGYADYYRFLVQVLPSPHARHLDWWSTVQAASDRIWADSFKIQTLKFIDDVTHNDKSIFIICINTY